MQIVIFSHNSQLKRKSIKNEMNSFGSPQYSAPNQIQPTTSNQLQINRAMGLDMARLQLESQAQNLPLRQTEVSHPKGSKITAGDIDISTIPIKNAANTVTASSSLSNPTSNTNSGNQQFSFHQHQF